MIFLKRNLPLVICFISGVVFALTTYIPAKLFGQIQEQGSSGFTVIQSIALLFGCVYASVHHIEKIRRKEKGFGFSVVLIVTLFIMFAVGIVSLGKGLDDRGKLHMFGWMFMYVCTPLQATMFSLLGFFIASAAFRAFKIKNVISAIMFLAVTIVILGRTPIMNDLFKSFIGLFYSGEAPPLSAAVQWILQNPVMAAQRAILMGIALGIVITSLKTIFGLDKSWLGQK